MSIDVSEDIFSELNSGDGVLGAFFTLLWTKVTSKKQHLLTGINIPDTIIYQYSKPLFWYFTAKDGTVKRKLRSRLNCGHIEEQFLKHGKSACGVVGQQITSNLDSADGSDASLTYATRKELRAFLQGEGRQQRQSGLFQLFFDPKPSPDGVLHNSLLQAIWSPNCFVIDKRVNRHRMSDERLPLRQRLATFDDYANSESVPTVSIALRDMLFDACSRVAEHIEILFSYRVAQMSVVFKIDSHDTPWLQWCCSLRISQWDNPQRGVTATLGSGGDQARQQRNKRLAVKQRKSERLKRWKAETLAHEDGDCPLCERSVQGLVRVPRQAALFGLSVLDHFNDPATSTLQYDAARSLARRPEGVPPRCVSLLCPEMTGAEYDTARQNDRWQQQRVRLCGDCLTQLIRLTESIRVDGENRVCNPLGGAPERRSLSAQALREVNPDDSPARAATSLGSGLETAPERTGVVLPPLRPALGGRRGPPVSEESSSVAGLSEVPTSEATFRSGRLSMSSRIRQGSLRPPRSQRSKNAGPPAL